MRLVDCSQPYTGVEQKPHSTASHSASTGSSMSGGSGNALGQAPRNVFGCGSGTTRANGLPRLSTCTISPASNHLDIRPNWLRRSRTVAVFMVIHMYHAEACMSNDCSCNPGPRPTPASNANRDRPLQSVVERNGLSCSEGGLPGLLGRVADRQNHEAPQNHGDS